jgi:RimJ/RimL family protein N-acetyltransferase
MAMQLELERCAVRSWRLSDVPSIAPYANNRKIWINLRDAFPHPYTIDDARRFIEGAMGREPETYFAIVCDDHAVGSIGFVPGKDVERCSAEIGCWVAEEYWGRGIGTAALRGVTEHALQYHGLSRVFAVPYAWNAASSRILEKAGYAFEGRMRKSAVKDGRVIDQLLYAYVRD